MKKRLSPTSPAGPAQRFQSLLPYFTALVVAVLYGLFHLHYMQQFLDYDMIVYVNNIQGALRPNRLAMMNPHHLHFETTGVWLHRWVTEDLAHLGLTNLAFIERLRALFFACLGIYFYVLFMRNTTGRLIWGVIGAVIIGMGHGYLHYATKVDTPIYPAAIICVILWLVSALEKSRRGTILLAIFGGVLLWFSVMLHQYMGIAAFFICVAIVLPPWMFPRRKLFAGFSVRKPDKAQPDAPEIEKRPGIRWASGFGMAIIGLVLIAGSYFYSGRVAYNLTFGPEPWAFGRGPLSGNTFQSWLFLYEQVDAWGYGFEEFDPQRPLQGYTEGWLSPEYPRNRYAWVRNWLYNADEPFDARAFAHNQLAYFTLFVIAASVLLAPLMWMRYKRTYVFAMLTGITFIGLGVYWEPHYFEFWIVPAIFVATIGIMLLNLLGEALAKLIRARRRPTEFLAQVPVIAYAVVLMLAVFGHNLRQYVVPFSRVQTLESRPRWDDRFVFPHFAEEVYRVPGNVYRDIYDTVPGSIFPEGRRER